MFNTQYHKIYKSDLFIVSVIRSEYDSSYSTPDYSAHSSISLPINSCFNYMAGNKQYTLNSSTVLIEKEDTEYMVSKFNDFTKDTTLSISFCAATEEISKLIKILPVKAALTHSTPRLDFIARTLLYKMDELQKEQMILNFINDVSGFIDKKDKHDKLNILVYKQINTAIEYINANYYRNIKISDIASAACMSIFHFSRIFKKVTAYSPYEYLIGVRLENAKNLLSSGESITQTAFATGFNSLENFSFRFKEITGKSPQNYLKNQKVCPVS